MPVQQAVTAAGPVSLPDMQAEYVKAQATAPIFAAMPDAALVEANQKDGLGLGLKMPATRFTAGAPIRLHVLYENLNATKPVAAGMCARLAVVVEDVDHGKVEIAQYTPEPCRQDSFYQNEVALPKGKPRSMDVALNEMAIHPTAPGRYLVNISWQAFVAGKETYLWGPTYSSLGSNAIPIVITQ